MQRAYVAVNARISKSGPTVNLFVPWERERPKEPVNWNECLVCSVMDLPLGNQEVLLVTSNEACRQHDVSARPRSIVRVAGVTLEKWLKETDWDGITEPLTLVNLAWPGGRTVASKVMVDCTQVGTYLRCGYEAAAPGRVTKRKRQQRPPAAIGEHSSSDEPISSDSETESDVRDTESDDSDSPSPSRKRQRTGDVPLQAICGSLAQDLGSLRRYEERQAAQKAQAVEESRKAAEALRRAEIEIGSLKYQLEVTKAQYKELVTKFSTAQHKITELEQQDTAQWNEERQLAAVHDQYQEALAIVEKQHEDALAAEKKLAAAEQQLAAAEEQHQQALAAAEQKLAAVEKKLAAAEEKLAAAEEQHQQQLAAVEKKLAAAEEKLAAAEEKHREALAIEQQQHQDALANVKKLAAAEQHRRLALGIEQQRHQQQLAAAEEQHCAELGSAKRQIQELVDRLRDADLEKWQLRLDKAPRITEPTLQVPANDVLGHMLLTLWLKPTSDHLTRVLKWVCDTLGRRYASVSLVCCLAPRLLPGVAVKFHGVFKHSQPGDFEVVKLYRRILQSTDLQNEIDELRDILHRAGAGKFPSTETMCVVNCDVCYSQQHRTTCTKHRDSREYLRNLAAIECMGSSWRMLTSVRLVVP